MFARRTLPRRLESLVRTGFLLGLAVWPAPVLAAQPQSGKWVIDYAKDYCVLSHDGLDGAPGIAFRTRPLAERHDVLFYVPRTNAAGTTKDGRVGAGEGDLGPPRVVDQAETEDGKFRFINTMVSKDEVAKIVQQGAIRLSVDNDLDLTVSLPQIGKAMTALRTCEDDLAKRWGLNITYLRNWAIPPRPTVAWESITKKRDWPDWNRNWGRNKASFTVDETGKATQCSVVESSGSRRMDRALCEAVLQMPFSPALDASGRPVPSAQMFGMYWAMRWQTRYQFWPR